jgi:hypothetical protein
LHAIAIIQPPTSPFTPLIYVFLGLCILVALPLFAQIIWLFSGRPSRPLIICGLFGAGLVTIFGWQSAVALALLSMWLSGSGNTQER